MTSTRSWARLVGAASLAGALVVAAGWGLRRTDAPPPPAAPAASAAPAAPAAPLEPARAEPAPRRALAAPAPAPPEAAPEAAFDDPFGDLAHYATHPISDVPHRVVRGWGVGPRSRNPGYVGATLVVDPGIGDAALASLVRDVREYHVDAHALAVRVFDSLEAATYDRHADGGALLTAHLVASVQRNARIGLDLATVRGESVEPSSGGALPAP
jgi:hypothetical protein